jgi:hypothetical protein
MSLGSLNLQQFGLVKYLPERTAAIIAALSQPSI